MTKKPPFAKKHWGQHFLKDPQISQDIVKCLGDTTSLSAVIEVGPGRGALTQWLLPALQVPFYAIEVDPAMICYLRATYPTLKDQLIQSDFTRFPLDQFTQGEIALIGNLPYNVGSQILFHAVTYRTQIPTIVCMLQKEVAQRIASPPSNKKYGLLSVWLQAFYTISYQFEVPPSAFIPPPKVTSAVLRMDRYRTSLPCHEKRFFKIVKTAFQQRRKILTNTLTPLGISADKIPLHLHKKRPEQLSVEDFIQITNLV